MSATLHNNSSKTQQKSVVFSAIKSACLGAALSIAMAGSIIAVRKMNPAYAALSNLSELIKEAGVQAKIAIPVFGIGGGIVAAIYNRQIKDLPTFVERQQENKLGVYNSSKAQGHY